MDGRGDWEDYLFSFDGRIGRGEYWLFVAIGLGYSIVVSLLAAAFLGYSDRQHAKFLIFVASLPLLWPSLAIAVKRLHDRDKGTGWGWLLIGVPLIGNYVTQIVNMMTSQVGALAYPLGALLLATFVLGVWAFIELGVLRGTAGDNRFGPDPLPPVVVAGGRRVVQATAPGGHRVRLVRQQPDGNVKKSYYYVAEPDPEKARIVVRDAMNARDEDVATVDTILHQTVQNLGMKAGEFVPVPRPG